MGINELLKMSFVIEIISRATSYTNKGSFQQTEELAVKSAGDE